MNRKIATALIVAAAAVAGNAFAEDITIDHTPFQSVKTRAEVQAELGQFKKAGTSPWSTQYNPLAQFKSARSSAEVRAEYVAARTEVAALNAEDSGSAYLAHTTSPVKAGTTLAGTPSTAY